MFLIWAHDIHTYTNYSFSSCSSSRLPGRSVGPDSSYQEQFYCHVFSLGFSLKNSHSRVFLTSCLFRVLFVKILAPGFNYQVFFSGFSLNSHPSVTHILSSFFFRVLSKNSRSRVLLSHFLFRVPFAKFSLQGYIFKFLFRVLFAKFLLQGSIIRFSL
jgi:hypothetical protein